MAVQLDLSDIQGNVLAAYGKQGFPKGRALVISVPNDKGAAARLFLETLRRHVTSALPWEAKHRQPIPGQVMAPRPEVTLNFAFTFTGLLALGVPIRTLRGMPDEFIDGMAARADILCDRFPKPDGSLATIAEAYDPVWLPMASEGQRVHILVTLNAQMDERTGQAVPALEDKTAYVMAMAEQAGLIVLSGHRGATPKWQELSARLGQRADGTYSALPLEHFGFVDGISDPVFDGQMAEADLQKRSIGQGKLLPDQSWAPLATGEFLLGWPDESQEIPGAAMPLDFSRNGTFMAYRKLHQNVFAWRKFMAEQSEALAQIWNMPLDEAEQTLAAKFAGRWRNGIPLVAAPSWAEAQAMAAKLSQASRSGDKATEDSLRRSLVDFTYRADPVGAACPFGSHIRRANTRDMLDPLLATNDPKRLNGSVLNNRRRILRRGLPYGNAPESGSDQDEHGIVMMALCANLFRQFEFVQQQWMQYGLDFNAGNDTCPIIGLHFPGNKFVIPADPASGRPPFFAAGMPQFVEPRGGEYFFVPSITALRLIAQGLVDPT